MSRRRRRRPKNSQRAAASALAGQPHAPEAAPAARAPEEVRRRWLRAGAEIATVLAGTFLLTRLLLRLSGGALWLPPEWRDVMQLLVPGFGLIVYGISKQAAKTWRAGSATRPKLLTEAPLTAAAMLTLLVGVSLLLRYDGLRNSCIVTFQPDAGFYEREFGNGDPDDLGALIPDFLDPRTNTVFVPAAWPEGFRRRLQARGFGDVDAGLQDMLDHDPMTLVDWLRVSGSPYLGSTKASFVWLHLGIIACVAATTGLTYSRIESAVEGFGRSGT